MKKNIMYEKKNAWLHYSRNEVKNVHNYGEGYKKFLNFARTERLSVEYLRKMAEKKGFKKNGKKKFYVENVKKNIAIVSMGSVSPLKGIKFVASHIDVPRIDIKQNPLFEKFSIAQLKTHYYGGIKKYQWFNRPLGIYGIIYKNDGTFININIGGEKNDPVFAISDLLPHLSASQYKQTVSEAFKAEKMNLIIGSIPLSEKEKDSVKKNIMIIINKKYGIIEEDFISAELEIVPVEETKDVGFDKGMIGGYGQDDRICAYASTTGLFDSNNKFVSVALMYDKEEIGSDGATGAKSKFLEDIIIEILKKANIKPTYVNIRETLRNSELLSADVNAGLNPDFVEVHDPMNAAHIGHGVVITKFTGSRGKSGANDANAEFVYKIRNIFNKNKVVWQTAELGKVDVGGGGTIAKFMAEYSINVIDCGPALLGMHSPFEIVSKADLFETYKAYRAFFGSK